MLPDHLASFSSTAASRTAWPRWRTAIRRAWHVSASLIVVGCAPSAWAQPYTFSHLAGTPGGPGFQDGTGSAARFSFPYAVVADGAGNVYVADTSNHVVRKVSSTGLATVVAGLAEVAGSTDGTGSNARFNNPRGIA
jgi:hypothetical protein